MFVVSLNSFLFMNFLLHYNKRPIMKAYTYDKMQGYSKYSKWNTKNDPDCESCIDILLSNNIGGSKDYRKWFLRHKNKITGEVEYTEDEQELRDCLEKYFGTNKTCYMTEGTKDEEIFLKYAGYEEPKQPSRRRKIVDEDDDEEEEVQKAKSDETETKRRSSSSERKRRSSSSERKRRSSSSRKKKEAAAEAERKRRSSSSRKKKEAATREAESRILSEVIDLTLDDEDRTQKRQRRSEVIEVIDLTF
jgi:hypothetical protein